MTDDRADLKKPEEWCRIEGVEILDADGWRGRDGRDWTDPISLAEFQDRLLTCTQRRVAMTDDRSAFTEARDAGLKQRHEQRLDRATYTAAEVRILTDAALLLGRREAREEIAALCEKRLTWTANRGRRLELQELAAELRSKGDPS